MAAIKKSSFLGEYYIGTQMIRDYKQNKNFLGEFMEDAEGEIQEERYLLMRSFLASKVTPMAWQMAGAYGILTDKNFTMSIGLIVAGELCGAVLYLHRQKSLRPFIKECKRKIIDSMNRLEDKI